MSVQRLLLRINRTLPYIWECQSELIGILSRKSSILYVMIFGNASMRVVNTGNANA
jgi:hypothetical protein